MSRSPSLQTDLVGKLLQSQRLVKPVLRRLVHRHDNGRVGHAIHDAAGQRRAPAGHRACRAQIDHVVWAELVLRKRRR